jgi:hypothetical protein
MKYISIIKLPLIYFYIRILDFINYYFIRLLLLLPTNIFYNLIYISSNYNTINESSSSDESNSDSLNNLKLNSIYLISVRIFDIKLNKYYNINGKISIFINRLNDGQLSNKININLLKIHFPNLSILHLKYSYNNNHYNYKIDINNKFNITHNYKYQFGRVLILNNKNEIK